MRTHSSSGRPAAVSITLPIGILQVEARPDATTAHLTLTPEATTDREAAGAIADTTITEQGGTLTITVPRRPARGGGFSGNVVVGQVVTGMTIVNGQIVGGSALRSNTGAVRAVLIVPASARLVLDSENGEISTTGPAGQITASTVNGGVRVEHAETVVVETCNGSIHAGAVSNLEARTTNGNIRVDRVTGSAVLRTTNGNIRAHTTTGDFSARSVNGDVQLSSEGVSVPRSAVRTVHGSVTIR